MLLLAEVRADPKKVLSFWDQYVPQQAEVCKKEVSIFATNATFLVWLMSRADSGRLLGFKP